jgi:hypothetical protein
MILKSVKQVESQTGRVQVQMGGSNFKKYTLKNSAFVAESNEAYIIDTSNGSFEITLPSNPETGDVVSIADAKGTWNDNPATFLNNGKKIESIDFNFINNSQGTFFSLVYVDDVTGWRILESGTKPRNLVAPSIIGSGVTGSPLTTDNGSWSGSPTSYTYQWQISNDGSNNWVNIEGATANSYSPSNLNINKFIRVVVIAQNSNGFGLPKASDVSPQIYEPSFPALANLLAFWKLDNTSDSTGDNNLTNVNNATFVNGKIGNAALCTNGSYFTSNAQINSAFSLSCWFKTTQTGATNRFMTGNETPGGNYLFLMEHAGRVYANWRGASQIGPNPVDINDGQWHHAVLTWDESILKLYVDGELSDSANNSGSVTPVTIPVGAGSAGQFNFNGTIDSFGVWNTALSIEDIDSLYNNGGGLEY